ncbi:MAG: hypothetical protein ACKPKO_32745, partial [Candidatus Fonsibacter sp.]
QPVNAIRPIIRVNSTELYICRMRNRTDWGAFIDDLSVVLDKKTPLDVYHIATGKPYSVLCV